jgi:hypothetical protein
MSERAEVFRRKALRYERAASIATDPDHHCPRCVRTPSASAAAINARSEISAQLAAAIADASGLGPCFNRSHTRALARADGCLSLFREQLKWSSCLKKLCCVTGVTFRLRFA